MRQSSSLTRIRPPRQGRKIRLRGIAGGGETLALADLVRREQKHVLLIARDPLSALHTVEEMEFLAPDIAAQYLPDWDILPYDSFSPAARVSAARITALATLLNNTPGLTVTVPAAAVSPMPPPAYIAARVFHLQVGMSIRLAGLIERLQIGGYLRVERVTTAGEYAVYGGQVDIFPPDAKLPFRLVLADDDIEQIRRFDPETQRSQERTEAIQTLPVSECDLSVAGIARFRINFLDAFGDAHADIYKQISNGEKVPGQEYYLPLFHDNGGRLFDYLGADAMVVTHHDLDSRLADFLRQTRLRQKIAAVYENRPVLPATKLFLQADDFFTRLAAHAWIVLEEAATDTMPPAVAVNPRAAEAHAELLRFIAEFAGNVVVAVDGKGRREALATVFAAANVRAVRAEHFADCLQHPLSLVTAPLRGGFILSENNLAVVTEAEIFQTPLPPRARRQSTAAGGGGEMRVGDILPGDIVVHRQYGVGRSIGLKNMQVGGETGEFLEIEYADNQRLLLPITQLHLLDRHHGGVELSKMGSGRWQRAQQRAARRARDTAARLLEISARRAAAGGRGHCPEVALMAKFTASFPHAETADQDRASEEVLADLRADKPMDRLLAADVGFGKTEIAARAAAAVVFSGAQVALMAPTTLLAEQHGRSFNERFADFPARVATLTRLTTAADRRDILTALAAGKLDIIIGTHALLQKNVRYHRPGLIIIDEEHRFGVGHKERFKSLRHGIDVLSLSATPIPRTLSLALSGVRDMSVMATPPASRLAIKTIVTPFSHAAVVEACEREILRGGQVFFIHNDIAGIGEMAEKIAGWLPRARLVIAHGGMTGKPLEAAMQRFLRREVDILVSTTIVESGLDIANANTVIVNHAERMGLSQLHQLRGRVGRGSVQGYAYFLTPPEETQRKKAQARLMALQDYATLGGGFFLSMRDLEIRGAGEILGERQSGDIETVGVAYYQRMVNEAARQLRGDGDTEETSADDALITLPAAALLPNEYVPSPVERMHYYRRLVACADDKALNEIAREWEDRFGALPVAASLLRESHRLRLAATRAAISEVIIDKHGELRLKLAETVGERRLPVTEKLLEKINRGDCRPAAANAVKKTLAAESALAQTQEALEFIAELVTT